MRIPRAQSTADIYHVIARGSGRQIIFEDDDDRQRFLMLLSEALRDVGAELYAWCLMDNHVHLLIHAPLTELSAAMRRACGAYAQRFNAKTGRVGHLFQDRFKSEPVSDNAYLMTVVRYIHENPAKAGVGTVAAYPWSSYSEYMGRPVLCTTDFVLGAFGGIDGFASFHHCEHANDPCLDVESTRSTTRAMPESRAMAVAAEVLGSRKLHEVKELPRGERNRVLCAMKAAGLSVRQIERLTGIGRGVIAYVKPDDVYDKSSVPLS